MRDTIRAVWPFLWSRRKPLGLGLAALIAKDVLGALVPLAMRESVDSISTLRSTGVSRVVWMLTILLGLNAVKAVFQYWMRVIVIGVSRDIEYDLRDRIFARLVTLDSGFFARWRTGDIMARATNDLNSVRMMLGPGIMYWTETSLTFALALGIMLWSDWRLTLIALAPAPVVSVAVIVFGQWIHRRYEKIQERFSDISSRVQESLSGVRVLRAYAQEEAELARFEEVNRDFIGQNLRLSVGQGLFMPLLETLIGLSFVLVLWSGGQRLINGQLTLGGFLMFNFYLGMLSWPMIALGWVVNLMQRGSASWRRLEQLLGEQPKIAAPDRPRPLPSPLRGEIEFQGVTMEHKSTKALDDVSLRIPAGSTIAFVGPTGCGKTTLAQMIPRLLDPTRGRVLLDGTDVREFDPAELRRAIGFVPQETFLFSANLAENIAWGVPDAPREAIEKAAEAAGLGPDIAAFPDGYETKIGERGLTLSGGQKQRTAIARAIVRDPRLLILDDALSAVDTITEERILANLGSILRGRTAILIAHRVSTIRQANWIVVLDRGRIVEQGTHDELVARGGFYAELCDKQALEEELEAT
ncbi:MAG: ABC transporter ATP-binding protein [Bryobacteraceae bacterium]